MTLQYTSLLLSECHVLPLGVKLHLFNQLCNNKHWFFFQDLYTPSFLQWFRISLLFMNIPTPKKCLLTVISLVYLLCQILPVAEAAIQLLRFIRNCVLCDFISCWEALILPERYATQEWEEEAREIFKWCEQRMWGNTKSAGERNGGCGEDTSKKRGEENTRKEIDELWEGGKEESKTQKRARC